MPPTTDAEPVVGFPTIRSVSTLAVTAGRWMVAVVSSSIDRATSERVVPDAANASSGANGGAGAAGGATAPVPTAAATTASAPVSELTAGVSGMRPRMGA